MIINVFPTTLLVHFYSLSSCSNNKIPEAGCLYKKKQEVLLAPNLVVGNIKQYGAIW